jgi:serpin B
MRIPAAISGPAACLAVAVLLAGCSSAPTVGTAPVPHAPPGARVAARIGPATELVADVAPAQPQTAAAGPVAVAEQRFSVALLHALAASDGNVSVSPSSLAIALTMLENGASGATRRQLATALQAGGLSLSRQDAGWQALLADWSQSARAEGVQIHSADAAWTQQNFPIQRRFLTSLQRYFAAGVWRTDFAHQNAAAVRAINTWTSRETRGKIPKLFDSLDPATRLVLANAAYFKAAWEQKFDPHDTADGPFTTAAGNEVTVPLMHADQLSAPAVVASGYQAVQLPYQGRRFAALAIMPTTGSLASFTTSLTVQRLDGVVSALQQQPVSLTMPRLSVRSTLDLPTALRSMGMTDAFTPGADFSALSPSARRVGLHVQQVVQRDDLSVTEKGTEAAAATGMSVGVGALMQATPIQLTHPFLFLVRDTKTGAILFAARIEDPSAS